VNNCYRELQDKLGGIPARGDKTPEARATYRKIRLGKKRVSPMWSGIAAWMRPPVALALAQ